MKYRHIDGNVFRRMLENGLRNLRNNEKRINAMNVFPVSDGDTGTNMCLTLESGIQKATPNSHLGLYLKECSGGMLLGARGNSGVILSQLFKGFSDCLQRCGIANPREIEAALTKAYLRAYEAVDHPVEGTILTVAREGITKIKGKIGRGTYVNDVYSLYLLEMRKSLKTLPTLLPILDEAGVDDSGALGYILVVEGMVKALYEEDIPLLSEAENRHTPQTDFVSDFNKRSEFKLGYCQEFLLQLLDTHTNVHPFKFKDFTTALRQLGGSLIAVQEGDIVKVHIHTMTPAKVMAEAQRYGEFISFKLDNLDYQHANLEEEEETKMLIGPKLVHSGEKLGVVVSGGGPEMSQMLIDSGASLAIVKENGISIEEYLKAFKEVGTPSIVVLPGNGNNVSSAEQARDLYQDAKVTIIPNESVVDAYYALCYGTADIEDEQERIKAMEEGSKVASTLYIAPAIKDYSDGRLNFKKGDYVGLSGKTPLVSDHDIYACLKNLLSSLSDLEDRGCAFIITGKDVQLEEDALNEIFEKSFPSLSFEVYEGGQSLCALIVGLI